MESRDVHFDESGLVEPSRVTIETEISQNDEETENLPVKTEKETESDSDSSVDLQKLLDGDSDDDDDDYSSDTSSEGYGTAGSSGSNARSSSAPDDAQKRPIGSATELTNRFSDLKNPRNDCHSPHKQQKSVCKLLSSSIQPT